tara:strand:- start:1640 stop:1894 length:255 start_codon:yes stop_codon:yes gene_type:complete
MLEEDVESYYNNYFDLFMLEGWEQFMADVQSAADTVQLLALQNAKDLHLAQGQLQVFQRLLNWQDSITNGYELVKEEAEVSDGI